MIALLVALALELGRLDGQTVAVTPLGYDIVDIAGEGRPVVGVVEPRDGAAWVAGVKLLGPLAHPRIAGPGAKVWVLGEREPGGLRVTRLGVLAPRPGN